MDDSWGKDIFSMPEKLRWKTLLHRYHELIKMHDITINQAKPNKTVCMIYGISFILRKLHVYLQNIYNSGQVVFAKLPASIHQCLPRYMWSKIKYALWLRNTRQPYYFDESILNLGWWVLKLCSLMYPSTKCSILQKYLLNSLNNIHIRQVSSQMIRSNICRI